MAETRLITRPQSLLRSFFGLGPAQVEAISLVVPTIDVEHLFRSNEDIQVLNVVSAAIAPGAQGSVNVLLPVEGVWLVHGVSCRTLGPATSGSTRMSAYFSMRAANWGFNTTMGMFDKLDLLQRSSPNALTIARWFDKPPVLYRSGPIGSGDDSVVGFLLNDAGSVGNAVLDVTILVRQLEPV